MLAPLAALAAAGAVSAKTFPAAKVVLPLVDRVPRTISRSPHNAAASVHGAKAAADAGHVVPLNGSAHDSDYVTTVKVGGQDFQLIVDTGSADLWLPAKDFQCFDLKGNAQDQATCAFGATYSPDTFVRNDSLSFNISYGGGEFLSGQVGYDTVQVGDLTVKNQEIGYVTKAAWDGDGVASGIIGLAFPNLTSAFATTDPTQASSDNRAIYNPFFFSAIADGAVDSPVLSVALSRGNDVNDTTETDLGSLALGGIDPSVKTTDLSITTPNTVWFNDGFLWFRILLDNYTFPGYDGGFSGSHAILDTGTTLTYTPNDVAFNYSAIWDPPAVFNNVTGMYEVGCDQTPPTPFSIGVDGTRLEFNDKDLIFENWNPDGSVTCVSGIQAGGLSYVLGATFLRNYVATMDVVAQEVTLTQRAPY